MAGAVCFLAGGWRLYKRRSSQRPILPDHSFALYPPLPRPHELTSLPADDDDDGRVLVVPPLETTGQDLDGVHQVFVIGSDAGESGYGSLDYSFEEAIERNTQLNARTRFPRLEPGEAATGTSGYYYSSTGGYVYGSGSGSYY